MVAAQPTAISTGRYVPYVFLFLFRRGTGFAWAEAHGASRMASVRKILASAVLLMIMCFLGVWFTFRPPRVEVTDVTRAETIVLSQDSTNGHVYALSIHGFGTMHGEATVTLLLGGQPYRVEDISGDVDFHWGGDWYSDRAEIRYQPKKVQGGKLILSYRFSTISSSPWLAR